MDISAWWPLLRLETRTWLIAHNGEPVPRAMAAEIVAADDGKTDPRWWEDESDEFWLTDEAIDWIEAAANEE